MDQNYWFIWFSTRGDSVHLVAETGDSDLIPKADGYTQKIGKHLYRFSESNWESLADEFFGRSQKIIIIIITLLQTLRVNESNKNTKGG